MARARGRGRRAFGEIWFVPVHFVAKLPSGRCRARDSGPDLQRHSAPSTFMARIDAEGWLVNQERVISRGEWQPPPPGKPTPTGC